MTDKRLPTAIWSGSFKLFGVDVKCHVLDNGQHIIEAESVHELFEAMGVPGEATDADVRQMEEFARWRQGGRKGTK